MSIKLMGGEFEKSIFPGGEVHVRITQFPGYQMAVEVEAVLKNSEDIITLLMLNDALKKSGRWIHTLTIPYVPYGRQDRVCNEGEAFSLHVMAELINSIKAQHVAILDPHSDVTPALIKNVKTSYMTEHSTSLQGLVYGKTVVCPDAGAEKRIAKLKLPYIMATKVRDPQTTRILHTEVYADKIKGTAIIIDDICDGGRTFIELAKVLRAKGAEKVELFVTHGIFSAGRKVFVDHINTVYYYDYETKNIVSFNPGEEQ